MVVDTCLSPETLKDYLAGRLGEDESASLELHLDACPDCERVLCELEREPDTYVEALRTEADTEEASDVDPQQFSWSRQFAGGLADKLRSGTLFTKEPSGNIGSYELLSKLGQGGMGSVYLARHRQLDKKVAVKLLPALSAQRDDTVARFQREMRAAGRLEHPAIVRATDAGEAGGVHYLVMEAIDGLDISRVARYAGRLSVANACEIVRQAAVGLAYAHEQGIVHRDVKPSNLMLDRNANIKILDLGLAQLSLCGEPAAEITTVGQLVGTLDYMAPEQAERGCTVDAYADVYSLAATLYCLLAGHPPLARADRGTPIEKLRSLIEDTPQDIALRRHDLPVELSKLIMRWLNKEPTLRASSAQEVADLLSPFCESADLLTLLNDSYAGSGREPEAGQAAAPSDSPLEKAAAPAAYGYSRVGWWIGLAMLPILPLAGFVIVLETSKGKLVIDSKDVNVVVKISRDGKEVDTMEIHPGRQTTKLHSGKYEVTIDSGSDSFAVDRGTFTIRRGDTIVATISKRPGDGRRISDSPTIGASKAGPPLKRGDLAGAISDSERASLGGWDETGYKRWLDFYERVARHYSIKLKNSGKELEVTPEPVFSYQYPEQFYRTHGSIFIWSHQGRPQVVGCIRSQLERSGVRTLVHELLTLSSRPLIGQWRESIRWIPGKSPIEFKPIPGAEHPASTPAARLAQRGFLIQQFDGTSHRETERPLTPFPQPLYEYEEGTSSGGVYGLFDERDAEIILLLESRVVDGEPTWTYAAAPFSEAELTLRHEDEVVWNEPERPYLDPTKPFYSPRPSRHDPQLLDEAPVSATPLMRRKKDADESDPFGLAPGGNVVSDDSDSF